MTASATLNQNIVAGVHGYARFNGVADLSHFNVLRNFDLGVDGADTSQVASQATHMFADTRTLAASANENLDLNAGALIATDGSVLTLTKVYAIIVYANAANTNNVVIGGEGANGFVGPFGAEGNTFTLKPGDHIAISSFNGWTVTPGTGDQLEVANSGAGSSVSYDIVVIGAP